MPHRNRQGEEKGMRHVREVLRLRLSCGMGLREIGRSLRMSHNTVRKYVHRIEESGLDWGKISAMNDEDLAIVALCYSGAGSVAAAPGLEPDSPRNQKAGSHIGATVA